MRTGLVALAVAVGLSSPLPVAAHHGAAAFDTGKKITITGVVQEWVYSNPHCLLRLEVKGEDGQVQNWVAEGQAPNVIFPSGYRRDTFKPGDKVSVTVEPLKNGRPMGRIISTVLADGRTLGPASSAPPAAAAQP